MKNKSIIIIVIQSIAIMCLIWVIIVIGKDEIISDDIGDDENVFVDYTKHDDGLSVIQLPKAVEINSNIKYEEIKKTSYANDSLFYGESINIKPLIELNSNLTAANNKLNRLKVSLAGSKDQLDRLIILNEDNKNVSDGVVREKKIELAILQNEVEALENDRSDIMATIQNEWGEVFTAQFNRQSNGVLTMILSGKNKLIKVTFSPEQIKSGAPKIVNLSSTVESEKNYEGKYFSEVPEVDKNLSGRSFYYLVHNSQIVTGEKYTGHETASSNEKSFLFIPKNTVVWSNGIPWAYIYSKDANEYTRKSLGGIVESGDGWIIEEGNFNAGDMIVTEGSQLLLSEEFKYQIKNENED
jgi:hypothetical protein